MSAIGSIQRTYFEEDTFAGPLAVLDAISRSKDNLGDEPLDAALLDLACTAIEAFEIDGSSPTAYCALNGLSAQYAQRACDLLVMALFQDGEEDVAALDDAALLSLVALLSTSGRLSDAASVLAGAEAARPAPSFRRNAFTARCSMFGYRNGIADLWLTSNENDVDIDDARAVVFNRPLDIAAHVVFVRQLGATGNLGAALDAMAVALALPLGDEYKAALAPELAMLAPIVFAHAAHNLFAARHITMALSANAATAARALALLGTGNTPFASAVGSGAMDDAAALLLRYANPRNAASRSPYPMVNGKPHADTIWLEVTNF